MSDKKIKLKKRIPIERVYKDGKEAIVKDVKGKVFSKSKSASLAPFTAAVKSSCAIQEVKRLPGMAAINEYELPSYNTATRITLIVKDPFWIYAYWEISEDSVEQVRRQLGGNLDGTKFIVRMYDVTYKDFNGFNANHWFDIEVGRHSNNWYINLWNNNVSYCGEIGILHNSGRFFPMARSNFVHTPRSSSSNRSEEIWMDLTEEQELPCSPISYNKTEGADTITQPFGCYSNMNGAASDLSSEALAKEERVRNRGAVCREVQYDITGKFSYSAVSKKRRIYLSEADLREYYSKFSPILRERLFSRISRKKIYRYLYSSMPANEWRDVLYFKRLAGTRFGRKVMIGASEFAYLGGSENIRGGSSEFVQPDKKHKFFFEIGTELIVYGRTEPDAEVRLGDKKIGLKPDGTFSMRLALPDGKIDLPFTATSKDKIETRKIETIVERKTL